MMKSLIHIVKIEGSIFIGNLSNLSANADE